MMRVPLLALLPAGIHEAAAAERTAGATLVAAADITPAAPLRAYSVLDFGARGDNYTDCTTAFQGALHAAGAARGGEVYVPPGLYILAGNLSVPPGVTLRGSYGAVPSHQLGIGNGQSLHDGSVLIPIGGRGATGCAATVDPLNCTAAFVTLGVNAVVKNLVVYYAEQETVQNPVPYPWTFWLGGNNAALIDVEMLGCWNCVAAVYAARHYIARVQGQAINIGVFVDRTHDVGRIEDVHWIVTYSSERPFVYHQTTHGRAFVFGRSDWQYVLNTFAYGYAVGYHFVERPEGSTNGNFVGIGADSCTNHSVLVEQSQPFGILITNGEFTAWCDRGANSENLWHQHGEVVLFCRPNDATIAPVHVQTQNGNLGALKFVDCEFQGQPTSIAILGAGTEPAADNKYKLANGTVSFIGCHFADWDDHLDAAQVATRNPCIKPAGCWVQRGSPAFDQRSGQLLLSGNDFVGPYEGYKLSKPGVRHVAVGPNARKTLVVGNIINAGRLNVTRASVHDGTIVVANNVDDSPQDMQGVAAAHDANIEALDVSIRSPGDQKVVAELREKVARLETLVEQLLLESPQTTA